TIERQLIDRERLEQHDRRDEISISGNAIGEYACEVCKSDSNSRDRARLNDQKEAPAKQKPDRWSISFAQENVLPARPWPHGSQLGATERAGNGEHAGERPGHDQPARRADESRRFSGRDEDSRSD